MASKAAFWRQQDFYGVDLSSLEELAADGYFRQVVVDAIDPACLVSGAETRIVDFGNATAAELARVVLPLRLVMATPGACEVHGIAAWFDVLFEGSGSGESGESGSGGGAAEDEADENGFRKKKPKQQQQQPASSSSSLSASSSSRQRWLSTAPGLPTTHWFQLRCVLRQPLLVSGPGVVLEGELVLEVHERLSYDVHLSLSLPASASSPGSSSVAKATFNLEDPYYRQTAPWSGGGSGWGGVDFNVGVGIGVGGSGGGSGGAAPAAPEPQHAS